MSYDIWLVVDTGGDEPTEVGSNWNYTSNMAPAWCEAGADLAAFAGKPAGECVAVLDEAIKQMIAEPEKYKAFNAKNGWGSYDTLLPALQRLFQNFRNHPKAIVRVSR